MKAEDALAGLLATLEQARESVAGPAAGAPDPAAAAGWLQRCTALVESAPAPRPEPVRTLHHFSCTGGTLIGKCIAALPNVQLLSEVDPWSTQLLPDALKFSPTDMVTLLRQSSRGATAAQIAGLFAAQVRFLQQDAVSQGLRLVLRDHAHSHFCHGAAVPERPNLRQLMPADLPLLSLLTVRHPLDSFASLQRNGWVHFEPRTLDAYCRRYLQFLDSYAGVPVLRYEDFVAAPQPTMQRLCTLLDLQHEAHFEQHFAGVRISGDSGRSGETIAPRPSHAAAVALESEAGRSLAFCTLIERLGYGPRAGSVATAEPAAVAPARPQNSAAWRALFDRVLVISLPGSTERRDHIREHLPTVGVHDYEFFDATGADDPAVALAYDSGDVASFPGCFRCGGTDCGNADCNNVLIPPQVATFITYRRLWRHIADGSAQRVLVLEDDVRFHDHAPRVLDWLADAVANGSVPFVAGRPALLRLGWARCAEHAGTMACAADATIKMSNPCHALTRDYAAAMLARDRGVVHTVDEYQHRLAPLPGEAWTVFPPLASELSWSDGRFASTIHPKPVRLQFLRDSGDHAAAARHAQVLRSHVKKKHYRPLLVVGHPRCGTGYAADLCAQLGLDVGHEKLGKDGISSWMFAVDADDNPYALDTAARTRRALAWKHLLMPVRDLATAAGSVMRDSVHAPPSYNFRREHILRLTGLDLDSLATPLERALRSVTSWARIVLAQKPDLWFRIEDPPEQLREFLIGAGLCPPERRAQPLDTAPVNADKPYQGVRRPKPGIAAADWQALPAATRAEVDWYCAHFGYANPIRGEHQ